MGTVLNNPYKSQYEPDASESRNDWAAFDGEPQPDLAEPDNPKACLAALGAWGQQVTARIVKPTDTLWSLGQAYYGNDLKMSPIQYFNGLAPADVIRPGQILLIPEPALPGDASDRPAPAGLTASPQLGGRVKH